MDFIKQNKSMVILGVGIMLIIFVYNSFISPIIVDGVSEEDNSGQDLVNIANSLSQANLNREVFSQSGYKLLRDFSFPIAKEPLGRDNPFAPIGR